MNTTTNNKKYTKPYRSTYPKVKVLNLTKSFETFEEGYADIIKLVPEVKAYGGEELLHDSVVTNILKIIKDNIPSTNNTNYPNTLSFSIDAHEIGLKTDSQMAFGWREIFDREAGKIIYKFRVTFISVPTYRKSIVDAMKEAGWEVIENQVQSRFWNSVEGNHRPRNNSHYTPKKEDKVNEDMKEAFDKAEETKTESDDAAENKESTDQPKVEA